MATWIVHLRIAENLLGLIDGLDETYFSIGNIAPDSGIPDENWENFDPPPEISHFMIEAESVHELADLEFYRQYLLPLGDFEAGDQRFSFLLGYFFHLVIDNLWNQQISLPTQSRFAAEFATDPKFIWEVKRDWYGLDLAHVREHRDSLFWRVFLKAEYSEDYLEFLPPDAVRQRMDHIKELYQRTDERIEEAYGNRPDKYLSLEDMDAFIQLGTKITHHAFTFLWHQEGETTGHSSVLETEVGIISE